MKIEFILNQAHLSQIQDKKPWYHLKLAQSLEKAGHQVVYSPIAENDSLLIGTNCDLAIVDKMLTPLPNAITIRPMPIYPYILFDNAERRENMSVALKKFSYDDENIKIPELESSTNFAHKLRKQLWDIENLPAPLEGNIFIPLQGKITAQRQGQICSPIEMVKFALEKFPDTKIMLKLHPGEKYSTEETNAIDEVATHKNIIMIDDLKTAIFSAKMIFTMNSSVGFLGFLAGRSVVFFGNCEFSHMGYSPTSLESFDEKKIPAPRNLDQYVTWYLRRHCIDRDHPNAIRQSFNKINRFGFNLVYPEE